jgi:hypothetical protein
MEPLQALWSKEGFELPGDNNCVDDNHYHFIGLFNSSRVSKFHPRN